MNHRQRIKWLIEDNDYFGISNFGISETEVVENLINRLLENLYVPCKGKLAIEGHTFVTDRKKLKKHKLDNEPVNWGHLLVCETIKVEGEDKFIVKIEEASPGDCPNLCSYVEKYMKKWGWNIEAITEW